MRASAGSTRVVGSFGSKWSDRKCHCPSDTGLLHSASPVPEGAWHGRRPHLSTRQPTLRREAYR